MENFIVQSSKTASSLVRCRPRLMAAPKNLLFVTISPNPKTVIGRGPTKKCYGGMTIQEQYQYCMRIFQSIYLKFLGLETPEYVGTWELNQSGKVHLHFLILSDTIKNDYQLKAMRQDIWGHELTQANLSAKHYKDKKTAKDVMNHIVFLTESIHKILEYLDKDHHQKIELMPQRKMYNFASPVDDDNECETKPPVEDPDEDDNSSHTESEEYDDIRNQAIIDILKFHFK